MASPFEEYIDAIYTHLNDSSITFHRLDPSGLSTGASRRVVWSSSIGKLVEPERIGGTLDEAGANRARQLYSNQLNVSAEIWGGSFEEAFQLRDNVVVAARRVLKHASRPCTFEVKGGNSWLDRGTVIIQQFVWSFALLDQILPLTPILSFSHEGLLNEEGGAC